MDEYDNIKKWAETNNMKIHPSKTKELDVTLARTRSMHPPSQPFIEGAERVTTLKVLGVLLNARFTMTDHVSQVLNTCSSSMFALRLLRTHGLQSQFTKYSKDIKHTWNVIKTIIKSKPTENLIESLTVDCKSITDSEIMAEKFNNYFTGIAHNLASKIPQSNCSPLD